jgi:hypothetical protein
MIAGIEMDIAGCFPGDYRQSQARFIESATAAGGKLSSYANPNKGPYGEDLATDVAWFGRDDARNVLVLVCSTHGVEGFCGAGAQLDWIKTGCAGLDNSDQAVLLVHAINPHGYAWLRRTTEEGVDLNRNCILFENGLPENRDYDTLADAFLPKARDQATLDAAQATLDTFRAEKGNLAFNMARSSGQYSHPEGFFYGGSGPTWSLSIIGRICADFRLAERDGVAIIDYHTGLGSYGHGEPICGHKPGTSGQARCRSWYGPSLGEPLLGKSSSVPIAGLTQYAWARGVGDEKLTFVALEFGTYEPESGAIALRDDHWLHAYGAVDWPSEETQAIKTTLRNFYHPAHDDWKELVLMRSRQVIAQALRGLPNA